MTPYATYAARLAPEGNLSLARLMQTLSHAVEVCESEKSAAALCLKPVSARFQLKKDTLSWIKQVNKASSTELAKHFEVTPVYMAQILSELKRNLKIANNVDGLKNVWRAL